MLDINKIKLMRQLPVIFFFLVSICPLYANSIQIRLPYDQPGEWKKLIDQEKEGGKLIRVWSREVDKEDERIIVSASPFKISEIPSIDKAIRTVLMPMKVVGAQIEVLRKDEKEAIVKWAIKNETLCFCRLIVTLEAMHSVSYIYKGNAAHKVDHHKWLSFISKASLRNQ